MILALAAKILALGVTILALSAALLALALRLALVTALVPALILPSNRIQYFLVLIVVCGPVQTAIIIIINFFGYSQLRAWSLSESFRA